MRVLDVIKCRQQDGDIGVEIEMEASNMPPRDLVQGLWKLEADGSLRGESGEFVLRNPVSAKDVDGVFAVLSGTLKEFDTRIKPTYRAGVHVHINVQELTPKELMTFICLYFVFEEVLLSFCDKSRVGNHFCMRMSDASFLLHALTESVVNEDLSNLNDDNLRYASLNVTSLFKYGSVEFRALESTADFGKIKLWCKVLHRLREYARGVDSPVDILGKASEQGFVSFGREVFGEFYPYFSKLMTEDAIQIGVRNIQYVVYSRDWGSSNKNIFKKKKLF